jgi:hypothetical protein
VDAEPIGVMFPPRLAPKITHHHQSGLNSAGFCSAIVCRIFPSIAASGMLSVTELAMAEAASSTPESRFVGNVNIVAMPFPIKSRTKACSITLITTNNAAKNASKSQSTAE